MTRTGPGLVPGPIPTRQPRSTDMIYAMFARNPALLRRMGKAAFVFFLVKGLLWLAAPIVFLWAV